MKAEKWDWVVTVTQTLVNVALEKPRGWILRSYGLHKLKRTQEAFDLLLPVGEKFSKEWVIPYNLSCYCAQLGLFKESREWFKASPTILLDKWVPFRITIAPSGFHTLRNRKIKAALAASEVL